MSKAPPPTSLARGRRDQVGDRVALVDRLGAVAPPGRQRDHGQALDQAHDRAEGARARADHQRRAQRDAVGDGVEQDPLDLAAAREVRGAGAAGRVAQPAEVDDAPDPGRGRRRREAPRGDAVALLEARRDRRLHRVDQVVGDLDALERARQPGAAQRIAADDLDRQPARDASGVARERAQLVAAGQGARQRVADGAARAL